MQLAETPPEKPRNRIREAGKTPKLPKIYSRFSRALERESRHILGQSAHGKLDKDSAASLVNYMKLLKTLIEDEKSSVSSMSEEDIEKALKDVKAKP